MPTEARFGGWSKIDDGSGEMHLAPNFMLPDGSTRMGDKVSLTQLKNELAKPLSDYQAAQQTQMYEGQKQQAELAKMQAETDKANAMAGKYSRDGVQSFQTVTDADGNEVQVPVSSKPMPNTIQKLVDEKKTIMSQAAGTNADLQSLIGLIDAGKLETGPLSRAGGYVANATGFSTENSRNLSALSSKLQSARNAILLLNKGVQTDGDADRAMSEIIDGAAKNDTQLVRQRLADLVALNNRAVEMTKGQVMDIYKENGSVPPDLQRYATQPSSVNSGDVASLVKGGTNPMAPQADPRATKLQAAGFTPEQVQEYLRIKGGQ
jgi:hypothetical protein